MTRVLRSDTIQPDLQLERSLTPSIPGTRSRRPSAVFLAILVVVFAAAAAGAAYFDWIHWVEEQGASLILGLGAGVLLLAGGLVALIARGLIRRIGFVVLALAIGIFAGLLLGPSREPVIFQTGGKMTLHLTSPVDATATGEATCQNVASATEFEASNDYTATRLSTAEAPFVSIFMNKGDRWEALENVSRKDGVRLDIRFEGTVVTASGKPLATELRAGPTSTLTSTFTNAGGSMTFANLIPQTGPEFGGEPMDVAGTIEWTCGTIPS